MKICGKKKKGNDSMNLVGDSGSFSGIFHFVHSYDDSCGELIS